MPYVGVVGRAEPALVLKPMDEDRVVPPGEDAALARAAMAGDRAAFSLLVSEHYGSVYRLCCRYVPSEAEDLAQETFLRAFVHRERFEPGRPMVPWLISIARNLCIDYLRREKPRLEDDVVLAQASGETAVDEKLAVRQQIAWLAEGLAKLPECQREALALYHFEGLSYDGIAQALGAPIGSVMTWLHRGRATLREAMPGAQGAKS